PAFVRTDIGRGHRNRPGGPREGGNSERSTVLNSLVEAGMDPAMVAARVLEGIRDDELYIFTHPELKAAFEAQFNAVLTAYDRAPRSPALRDHVPQALSAFGMKTAG